MEEPGTVRAVARALAVLRAFAGVPRLTLAEVSRATGLDKGTARRLLLTLEQAGFVGREPASGAWRLGAVLRELAAGAMETPDLRAVASPVLGRLAADLGMTAFLSVYREGRAICLERVHDMRGIEVRWWAVGGDLPINCGGAPKLLLAHQPADEIERVLDGPFVALTPKSIMDRAALAARLASIRRRGYEFAVDDVALGLSALAVPVRGPDGAVAAAMSIAGLTPQMAARGRPIHLDLLIEAARRVEAGAAG